MVNRFKFDYFKLEKALINLFSTFVQKRHEASPETPFYWYGFDTYEEFGRLKLFAVSEDDLNKRVDYEYKVNRAKYIGLSKQNMRWYLRYPSDCYWWDDMLRYYESFDLERQLDALYTLTDKGMRQFDGTFVSAREELGEAAAREYVQPFIDEFRDTCIRVLQKLDKDDLFSQTAERKDVILTFKMYDEIEKNDLQILNPEDSLLRYNTQMSKAESFDNQVHRNFHKIALKILRHRR